MAALAIAKLSLILRTDEVSGLCMNVMTFQVTRASKQASNRRRRREANELMKSENKRNQLQVGQSPGCLSRSELYGFAITFHVRQWSSKHGPKQRPETQHKTEHLSPYWTTPHCTYCDHLSDHTCRDYLSSAQRLISQSRHSNNRTFL
jgi:hypothetical protein